MVVCPARCPDPARSSSPAAMQHGADGGSGFHAGKGDTEAEVRPKATWWSVPATKRPPSRTCFERNLASSGTCTPQILGLSPRFEVLGLRRKGFGIGARLSTRPMIPSEARRQRLARCTIRSRRDPGRQWVMVGFVAAGRLARDPFGGGGSRRRLSVSIDEPDFSPYWSGPTCSCDRLEPILYLSGVVKPRPRSPSRHLRRVKGLKDDRMGQSKSLRNAREATRAIAQRRAEIDDFENFFLATRSSIARLISRTRKCRR